MFFFREDITNGKKTFNSISDRKSFEKIAEDSRRQNVYSEFDKTVIKANNVGIIKDK